MSDTPCTACGGTLEAGSIATENPENRAYWVAGKPEETDLPRPGVQRGVKRVFIRALRCSQCGRLELFAKRH